MDLNTIADDVFRCSVNHGFTETPDNVAQKLMLVVEELTEAHAELRDGHGLTEVYYNEDKPGKPEGFPIELADAVIRLLCLMKGHGIDPEAIIMQKHNYNLTRPYKHGRQF